MKNNSSKTLFFMALLFVLLTAACGAEQGATPTVAGTILPVDFTETPGVDTTGTAETATPEKVETPTSMVTASTEVTTTGTAVSKTPGIPVTGVDIVLIECQFCVDTRAYALLVLPDTATFEVVSSTTTTAANDVTCSTVEVNNGKQVILCSAPEKTPLTLNICTDVNTCIDFPVNLMACPLVSDKGTAVPTKETATPGPETVTSTPSTPLASPSPTATP